MQPENIMQLDAAVSEVFALMLGRECAPGLCCPPASLQEGVPLHTSHTSPEGISASISFSGSMRGTCSIRLALGTASVITGELFGPHAAADAGALNADTAGELCNMIAGSWKSRQSEAHASSGLSTPLVTTSNLIVDNPGQSTSDLGEAPPFRHTLIRVYRFQEHCLRLELGFD